jgi:lipid-binding SYLF domain-containing protein
MEIRMRAVRTALIAALVLSALVSTRQPVAASGVNDARAALKKLYESEPVAKTIGTKARGILVFPTIVKADFMVGAQYGEGALLKKGKIMGHYNSVAGSYAFQAGAQAFGYAMFLMNDKALEYLNKSDGWEIGVGPSVVILDKGKAKSLTTTTLQDDVYALVFSQMV